MGEANRWQDAFSQALREQAILIAGLIKKVSELEKRLDETTKAAQSGQEAIQGISGTQYAAKVFTGYVSVPGESDPSSENK